MPVIRPHVVKAEILVIVGAVYRVFEKDLGFDKYTEINPKRFERIDYLDKPDGYVMDWNKAEDRLVLVKESGWYCSDPTLDDCKICTASNYCDLYAEGLVTK